MTVAEFIGCTFLAFGPPLAMFLFTIVHDPIRIIILISAAFFWLVSLLASALLWFIVVPLREYTVYGLVASVFIQEGARFVIYKVLRRAEHGLQDVADSPSIVENKHILAYVSGLGFGVMSGAFALVNVLADSIGPATVGLHGGTEIFFLISAAQTLCMILLHTFWGVIFFNAVDTSNRSHIGYVVGSHLFVSMLTLLNGQELYAVTLLSSYAVLLVTGYLALKVAGGSAATITRFVKCQ